MRSAIVVWMLTLAACNGAGTPEASPPDSGPPDSGQGDAPRDAGAGAQPDAGSPCGPPPPPYGTSLRSSFAPLELTDCEGTAYSFYGPEFCDATLTVLEMQAGWCGPSRQSAWDLTEINASYASRGVRVLEVLISDDEHNAPDAEYCAEWRDRYGLTNPVLLDVEQRTEIYFPAGNLPAVAIIDASGVIRYRQYGHDLEHLKLALDDLLAGRDP